MADRWAEQRAAVMAGSWEHCWAARSAYLLVERSVAQWVPQKVAMWGLPMAAGLVDHWEQRWAVLLVQTWAAWRAELTVAEKVGQKAAQMAAHSVGWMVAH